MPACAAMGECCKWLIIIKKPPWPQYPSAPALPTVHPQKTVIAKASYCHKQHTHTHTHMRTLTHKHTHTHTHTCTHWHTHTHTHIDTHTDTHTHTHAHTDTHTCTHWHTHIHTHTHTHTLFCTRGLYWSLSSVWCLSNHLNKIHCCSEALVIKSPPAKRPSPPGCQGGGKRGQELRGLH